MDLPPGNSTVTLTLRRYGDLVTYTADDKGLGVTGKHLFGSRYVLRFAYSELRPDSHVLWLKNSRQPVQLSLVLVFFVVFGLCVGAMHLVPKTSVAVGALVSLALLIGALLVSAFARRVEVFAFRYRFGGDAFTVPTWGCAPEEHRAFIAVVCERVTQSLAQAPSEGRAT